ncbi:MAG: apolipoprotein N-acyltransferase [Spirochaetales bacterium]|nr:apolipoprotein N-acyltransferase [Spirochaetales bacterium]
MSKLNPIMNLIYTMLLSLLSAILLSAGIPNEFFLHGNWVLGVVALFPLYTALRYTATDRSAPFAGALFLAAVHCMSSFWLANFADFAIFTLGGSSLFYFFLGLPVGRILREAVKRGGHLAPFTFAALWTLWEWVKSSGFLAYPWGTLVMAVTGAKPLIQIAEYTGTWGLSFILALIPACTAEYLLAGTSRTRLHGVSLSFTGALVLLILTQGGLKLTFPPQPEREVDLILVQQNADPWVDDYRATIQASQQLTRNSLNTRGKADLVVWSESILNRPYEPNRAFYERIPEGDPFIPFMAEIDTPLLVGSPVLVNRESREYSNSVILVDPSGEQKDWYGKIQLVSFAEYLPFTEYAIIRKFFDSLIGFSRGWIPGKEYKTMEIMAKDGKPLRFATPICFEDAFSALCARLHLQGSELLINLTNDAWSRTDSAEMQHHAIALYRSIELRTTLVRSTNAGFTSVIDPTGTIIASMPLFTAASMRVTAPVYPHTRTFYAVAGDWFPLMLLLIVSFFTARKLLLDRQHTHRYAHAHHNSGE